MDEITLQDKAAEAAHDIWAHWMNYMFAQGKFNEDGSWTMPPDKTKQWQEQAKMFFYEIVKNDMQQSGYHIAQKYIMPLFGDTP